MFETIVAAVSQGGYAGIFMLMFVENLFPPIPSELIMPLAGFVAARGELDPLLAVLAGTMGSIAPSTAHQATLDLHEKAPHSLMMEPPGLALHLWRPGPGLVTHVSYIGTYKGPEPFRTL